MKYEVWRIYPTVKGDQHVAVSFHQFKLAARFAAWLVGGYWVEGEDAP